MNEETAQTDIRVQEAEKAQGIRTFLQGRGAKKKDSHFVSKQESLYGAGGGTRFKKSFVLLGFLTLFVCNRCATVAHKRFLGPF